MLAIATPKVGTTIGIAGLTTGHTGSSAASALGTGLPRALACADSATALPASATAPFASAGHRGGGGTAVEWGEGDAAVGKQEASAGRREWRVGGARREQLPELNRALIHRQWPVEEPVFAVPEAVDETHVPERPVVAAPIAAVAAVAAVATVAAVAAALAVAAAATTTGGGRQPLRQNDAR